MSLNVWSFTGRLGRDAESKFLPNGTAVLEFSPAVDVGFGERKSTMWPRCSMFGERGQKIAQYMTKGQLVAVSGEMSIREYQAKDGTTKTSIEVRVNAVELIGSKSDSGDRQTQQQPARTAPAASPSRPAAAPTFDDDDDIPF